jgi:hypothetical protein
VNVGYHFDWPFVILFIIYSCILPQKNISSQLSS